jgi:hypothetical protein
MSRDNVGGRVSGGINLQLQPSYNLSAPKDSRPLPITPDKYAAPSRTTRWGRVHFEVAMSLRRLGRQVVDLSSAQLSRPPP